MLKYQTKLDVLNQDINVISPQTFYQQHPERNYSRKLFKSNLNAKLVVVVVDSEVREPYLLAGHHVGRLREGWNPPSPGRIASSCRAPGAA